MYGLSVALSSSPARHPLPLRPALSISVFLHRCSFPLYQFFLLSHPLRCSLCLFFDSYSRTSLHTQTLPCVSTLGGLSKWSLLSDPFAIKPRSNTSPSSLFLSLALSFYILHLLFILSHKFLSTSEVIHIHARSRLRWQVWCWSRVGLHRWMWWEEVKSIPLAPLTPLTPLFCGPNHTFGKPPGECRGVSTMTTQRWGIEIIHIWKDPSPAFSPHQLLRCVLLVLKRLF